MKMSSHEELVKQANAEVMAVFSDCSVGRAETKESLEEIISSIEDMLNTLDN